MTPAEKIKLRDETYREQQLGRRCLNCAHYCWTQEATTCVFLDDVTKEKSVVPWGWCDAWEAFND